MQITRAGDYGVQGMIYLSSLPDGGEAYVGEIASKCEIPSSFLAKIFQSWEGLLSEFNKCNPISFADGKSFNPEVSLGIHFF